MDDKFKIRICSDLDYEEMVAGISYENHTLAIISRENGINDMNTEILFPEEKNWKFSLNDFIGIIEFAKKRLVEIQKLSD